MAGGRARRRAGRGAAGAHRRRRRRARLAAERTPAGAAAPPAVGCDGANLQRAAAAGLTAAARVRAALAVLGEDAPAHLLDTGRLRLTHPQATLEQLGARADPPISKDAVAGRIRRLLALADTRAAATAVPPPRPRSGRPCRQLRLSPGPSRGHNPRRRFRRSGAARRRGLAVGGNPGTDRRRLSRAS